MTKTKPETVDATKKAQHDVTQIDFTKPFFLTFRQTPKRNIIAAIQGDNSDDFGLSKVLTMAADDAERMNATIAVFGPQVGVVDVPKPEPPKFVGMDFGGKK